MVCYEGIRRVLDRTGLLSGSMKAFVAGSTGRLIASSIFYPFVLVRSRLQKRQYKATEVGQKAGQSQPEEVFYKSLTDCFRQTWRREHFRGLYKGFIPNIMKTVPQQGIFFVGYEATLRFLNCYVGQ